MEGPAGSKMDELRYCREGHKGAYCSLCADGYRRFSQGHLCYSCDGTWTSGASLVLWVLVSAVLMLLLLLIVLVAFLEGGVVAVSEAS